MVGALAELQLTFDRTGLFLMAKVPERPFPLSWRTERTHEPRLTARRGHIGHYGGGTRTLFAPPVTLSTSTLYLFDGALLQMFLHRLLDEKLLLLDLHPRVLFHDVFQDRLVRDSSLVIARLQKTAHKEFRRTPSASQRESMLQDYREGEGGRFTCYAP